MILDDTLLGREEYKQHARQIAKKQGLISNSEIKIEAVILECESKFENIRQIYKEFLKDKKDKAKGAENTRSIPAVNILVENFYIILTNLNEIKSVMNGGGIAHLPERIYIIAEEMAVHSDCSIDRNKIMDFICAYQEIVYLSSDELWWLGAMLKIVLINKISNLCNMLYAIKRQRSIADRMSKKKKNTNRIILKDPKRESSLIEHFSYKMKMDREAYFNFKQDIDKRYASKNLNLDELTKFENERQNSIQISLSNAINSFRELDNLDSQRIYENLSHLEEILKADPSGVYVKMDDKSKDYYRKVIVKQARKEKVSEFFIAKNALIRAQQENEHIGRYVIDTRGKTKQRGKEKEPSGLSTYKAAIISISLITTFFLSLYAYTRSIDKGVAAAVVCTSLAALLSFFVMFEVFTQVLQKGFMSILKPVMLPRMDFSGGIPSDHAVMVIIPTLLSSEKRVEELGEQLESLYATNGGDNVYFALVGDLADAHTQTMPTDEAVREKARSEIENLNANYCRTVDGAKSGSDIFFLFLRDRTYNKKQNKWMGRERKRGAIIDFNNYLMSEHLPDIKYVVTLDADTKLTINEVQKLAGTAAHPLNKPVINKERGCVESGYGIFQTCINTELNSTRKSLFTKIFAGHGGIDTYSVKVTDLYMDMCGEGIFTGKGIYHPDIFNEILEDSIPDNLVLSHDLLEGSYLRTGFINDAQMIDSFPAKYNSYAMRLHRWIRGDWQIIRWLFPKVKNKDGDKVKNPLNAVSKWKIFDNLRRSCVEASLFMLLLAGCFIIPGNDYLWILVTLGTLFVLPVMNFIEIIINVFKNPQNKRYFTFSRVLSGLQSLTLQKFVALAFLPFTAVLSLGAVFKTLYRLTVTKKNMLEWVTAADVETILKGNLKSYIILMKACIISGVITFFTGNIGMYLLGVLWIAAPVIAWHISKPIKQAGRHFRVTRRRHKGYLPEEDIRLLWDDARKIWDFYEKFVIPLDNFLPPDNVQFEPVFNVAHRTSPTNIGFYILSVIAAFDMKFIEKEEAAIRIENTINTLDRMEKWNGHLYNWYDTMSLVPLRPRYISTVDSGNLQGYLLTTAVALKNTGLTELAARCERIADEMDFSNLYDKEKNLFSIGFNIEDGRLTNSYYDLLVSEARQTSFISLANRTVPEKHWKRLGRRPITVKGHIGLASWSGTAFEFLMPNLIMKSYESSLLDEAVLTCIFAQIDYVKARTRPWGISESGFYEFDLNLNYQYKAFGIPRLGLKKGLGNEFVVCAYASILALSLEPVKVIENLKILKYIGARGEYGYYEAIDYTPERISGSKFKIIKSHMAHHMGMSLIAIHNFLFDDLMKSRFHSIPYIKGAEYLLTERVPISGTPQNDTVIGDSRVKIRFPEKSESNVSSRLYSGIPSHNKMPACAVISNGRHSLFINQYGIGYSTNYGKLLADWDFDGNDYSGGFLCLLKNIDSGESFPTTAVFDGSFSNMFKKPDNYEFEINGDIVSFRRWDGMVETSTEITVATEDDVEIRKTRVINHGENEFIMEVSGQICFALAAQPDYMAHPLYNNLFITTEFSQSENLVIAAKRPKKEKEDFIYGFYSFTTGGAGEETCGDTRCDIDGSKVTFNRKIVIRPGGSVEFNFIFGINENKDDIKWLADKYSDNSNIYRAFELSRLKTKAPIEEFALDVLPHIFYHSAEKLMFTGDIEQCNVHRNDLWTFGISLDKPLILSFINTSHGEDWIEKLLDIVRFFDSKGFIFDLIFVAEEPAGYMQPVYDTISRINTSKRACVIRGGEISRELRKGLITFASVIFNNDIFDLRRFERINHFDVNINNGETPDVCKIDFSKYENKLFDNGVGFFVKDFTEYLIYEKPPVPWINVIASPEFGFTVDSAGQGCTWADNSRENRLTVWVNNIFQNKIIENVIAENIETGVKYSLFNYDIPHITRHGIGYSVFEYSFDDMDISVTVSCDFERPVKIIDVFVKNKREKPLELKLHYKVKPVIGVNPVKTFRHLVYEEVADKGVIIRNVLPENQYGSRENLVFHTLVKHIKAPAFGKDNAVLVMGKAKSKEKAIEVLSFEKYKSAYSSKEYYKNIIDKVKARLGMISSSAIGNIAAATAGDAFAVMFTGRLVYQAMSCRLYGRTALYQSSGAFGYRDQLQDSLVMIPYDSSITQRQILLCCRHQYVEGDVQHWWHEPDGKGIRSRYKDDLLWLPYVVSEYIKGTGDYNILNICENFIESPILGDNEDERYELPAISSEKASVYEHCIRAIKYSFKYGTRGLPLIGGGDWNDGMNKVGCADSGESVWLAWFLLSILNRFINICEYMQDTAFTKKLINESSHLLSVIDEQAYDGSWYKRAYFSNGEPLGSAVNTECMIDSISQSWGVIAINEIIKSDTVRVGSGKGRLLSDELKDVYIEHLTKSIESVEKYLVDYRLGIVKLLTPPFVKSNPYPGYIMGYIAGVRENGGQYTHASVWYVKALICMADLVPARKDEYIEKACNILNMLNPLNHARTPLEVSIYKVEPYVTAADIYADPEGKISGRGGWTWYTGAAGWMQQVAEELYGLR